MVKQLPQAQFPLIEEYRKVFDINEHTIFAYDDVIYSDDGLPNHLVVHEITHHEQQKRDGLDYWVEHYLTDPKYRLRMEVEAYKHQLTIITDRNDRTKLRIRCAHDLSSSLYGNICTYEEALKLLSSEWANRGK